MAVNCEESSGRKLSKYQTVARNHAIRANMNYVRLDWKIAYKILIQEKFITENASEQEIKENGTVIQWVL